MHILITFIRNASKAIRDTFHGIVPYKKEFKGVIRHDLNPAEFIEKELALEVSILQLVATSNAMSTGYPPAGPYIAMPISNMAKHHILHVSLTRGKTLRILLGEEYTHRLHEFTKGRKVKLLQKRWSSSDKEKIEFLHFESTV